MVLLLPRFFLGLSGWLETTNYISGSWQLSVNGCIFAMRKYASFFGLKGIFFHCYKSRLNVSFDVKSHGVVNT